MNSSDGSRSRIRTGPPRGLPQTADRSVVVEDTAPDVASAMIDAYRHPPGAPTQTRPAGFREIVRGRGALLIAGAMLDHIDHADADPSRTAGRELWTVLVRKNTTSL